MIVPEEHQLSSTRPQALPFEHSALFYADTDAFLAGTVPFLIEGAEAGECALVALSDEKIRVLRGELNGHAEAVRFTEVAELGRNPARIISAWRDFVAESVTAGLGMRGIGEPIWAGRSNDELIECEHHESLLNAAFADAPAWKLMCPYDTLALPPDVIEGARRTHPSVSERGASGQSTAYLDPAAAPSALAGPLPAPPPEAEELSFGAKDLSGARAFAATRAEQAGIARSRTADFALAVGELAANSIRHGGGWGILGVWREPGAIVCEVRDGGVISDQLVGRTRPLPTQKGGRGLWIVNELCDLVQIRSEIDGTVARIHMRTS